MSEFSNLIFTQTAMNHVSVYYHFDVIRRQMFALINVAAWLLAIACVN